MSYLDEQINRVIALNPGEQNISKRRDNRENNRA